MKLLRVAVSAAEVLAVPLGGFLKRCDQIRPASPSFTNLVWRQSANKLVAIGLLASARVNLEFHNKFIRFHKLLQVALKVHALPPFKGSTLPLFLRDRSAAGYRSVRRTEGEIIEDIALSLRQPRAIGVPDAGSPPPRGAGSIRVGAGEGFATPLRRANAPVLVPAGADDDGGAVKVLVRGFKDDDGVPGERCLHYDDIPQRDCPCRGPLVGGAVRIKAGGKHLRDEPRAALEKIAAGRNASRGKGGAPEVVGFHVPFSDLASGSIASDRAQRLLHRLQSRNARSAHAVGNRVQVVEHQELAA